MADTPYNAKVDKINIGNRARSTDPSAEELIDEGSDQAINTLSELPRGDIYRRKIEGQRKIAQRLASLSAKAEAKARVRGPRNAKFQNNIGQATQRIPTADAVFMGVVAFLYDCVGGLISLIDFIAPPIGEVINAITIFPLATFTLYFMYKKRGIEFKSASTIVRFWGSLLIGFIPWIAVLPEYTLNVVLVTLATKAEDKLRGAK